MSSHADASAQLASGVALHARPAGVIVRVAATFRSEVSLATGGRTANAKSILELLSLGAVAGTTLAVQASGEDASAAVSALCSLIPALV
jgi:phosphotransferase system HPr (HPr) family protein